MYLPAGFRFPLPPGLSARNNDVAVAVAVAVVVVKGSVVAPIQVVGSCEGVVLAKAPFT